MFVLLAACTGHEIVFGDTDKLPGDSPAADSADSSGPVDTVDTVDSRPTDTEGDAPPDTGVARPATCAAAGWAWNTDLVVEDADTSYLGEADGDWAGGWLTVPGDLDGDHQHDLVVGAPFHHGAFQDEGRLYFVTAMTRGVDQYLGDAPSFAGDLAEMELSESVGIGDVDGDNRADLAIDPGFQTQTFEPRHLQRGHATMPGYGVDIADADVSVEETTGNVSSGWAVEALGDWDGDGLDDVVVSDWGTNSGQVWIIADPASASVQQLPTDAGWFFHGTQDTMWLTTLGDVTGDGRADLLFSDRGYSSNVVTGYLVPGGGPSASDVPVTDVAAAHFDLANQNGVDAVGDLDGDGVNELVLYTYDSGTQVWDAYLYLGGQTSWTGALSAADASVHFDDDWMLYGFTDVGDINGDGFDDLAAEARTADADKNLDVVVWFGRATWPATLGLDDADIHFVTTLSDDLLRTPDTHQRGDLDGDGIADLVLTQPYADAGGYDQGGHAYVFRGRTSWDSDYLVDSADMRLAGSVKWQQLGSAAWLVVDDLDHDGCDDLVTSSYYHPTASRSPSGEVFVFHGQN